MKSINQTPKVSKNHKPRILSCSCKHEYQDQRYGKGKRVHTATKDDEVYRCTVCGKTTKIIK